MMRRDSGEDPSAHTSIRQYNALKRSTIWNDTDIKSLRDRPKHLTWAHTANKYDCS